MRLHDILDSLMDTPSKVRILRLMFRSPDREFSEREIASQIGMSPNTVNLAMRGLRETNVFHFKRIGRTHIYSCNKQSILFPYLLGVFTKERSLVTSLLDSIKVVLAGAQLVVVFGSFSKDEETAVSDIDLLIVANDKKAIRAAIERMNQDTIDRYATPISYSIYTKKEFTLNKDRPFIQKAMAEGVVLVRSGGF